jgi:hypothetical protein
LSKPGEVLAGRIISELRELEKLTVRARHAWDLALEKNDDYYLDSVALNLHGFYSGIERIFERIAATVDESVPSGANWHQELLSQMAVEVADIRPAVISDDLKESLEEYRGFRHIVRNVYAYHFNAEKLRILIEHLQQVSLKIDTELSAFAEFVRKAG